MAGLPPHPHPCPLDLWTLGRWKGTAHSWRRPLQALAKPCGPRPGGGFSRNTAPPGRPRAGHFGSRGFDSRARWGGAVLRRLLLAPRRASLDVPDTLSLFPPSLSPFRALWRVPPVPQAAPSRALRALKPRPVRKPRRRVRIRKENNPGRVR